MKITVRNAAAAIAAAIGIVAVPAASASVDYFLKIDGIPGESVDKAHANEIDVLSYSLGAARDATAKNKPACPRDIAFVKYLDRASPLLFANAVSGMAIPSATLTARKAGEGQRDFLIITLKDVIVTSVQNAGSTDAPVEQVSLGYGSLTLQYKPQKPDGSLGDPVVSTLKGC